MLATLGAPLDPNAAAYAVDTAVESGHALLVAIVTRLEPLPMSLRLGYDALEELTPELTASVKRSVELASSLGVKVERIRVRSPRPIHALIELVTDRGVGLLVFGPDSTRMPRRSYRRVVAALRDGVACLVWLPPEPA